MQYNKFSCFIIGEGTLPIQCAEILLSRGHEIYGVISPDALLKNWAEEKNIPHTKPTDSLTLVAFLSQRPFDYLFSIVNYIVLPEALDLPCHWDINYSTYNVDQSAYNKILELPRRWAINYHDAPLPRYAGFHATSWAIMQRETTHGVTWHVMTQQIDAGDILKQYPIDISSNETALTLNAKCYDAAITSFAELVEGLAYGRVSTYQQNRNEHAYFPFYKSPPAGCALSWSQSAQDIDAFVRALEFGPYPNPLGLPKLTIGKDFVIVSKLDVLDSLSGAPPGTLTGIADNSLTISTTTNQVALRKLLTIDGQPLPVSEAVARFGLYEGYKFEGPGQELTTRLTASDAFICKHEAFWVERLATLQPLTLPYYAVPTAPQDTAAYQGSVQYMSLPVPIPVEINTFLAIQHPTWRMDDFLLAAFVAYLVRLGGVNYFDIGFRAVELPPEGRKRYDLAGLEGFFASHVPLRLDINPAWCFEQVYEATRARVKLAKQHYTYARDIVVRYPKLGSTTEPPDKYVWPVIVEQVEKLDNYQPTPNSQFVMVISNDAPSTCRWVYDPKLFDEDSVNSMLHQFITLLHGIVTANAEQPLMALPLLTEAERYQLLVTWNDTAIDYSKEVCLHQLFEAQVERTPQTIAVVFDPHPQDAFSGNGGSREEYLTYRELNRRANQLAHYLRRLGVGPETFVGICVERSLEMVVGLLGILKAGGAYVPLDPAYPKERLAFMVEDAQSPVLLTQQALVEGLPKYGGRVVCLDTAWGTIASESDENPRGEVTPDSLAYVIYTSGSTGRPKGVMIPHCAICNHMLWMQRTFPLTETDAVLQKTPFSFDASVWEFYAPLLAGARLIMARPDGHKDVDYLIKVVVEQQVTTLQLVPSLLRLLLQEQAFETCDCLKRVFCGGEALSADLIERFYARLPANLYNLYGPTEATIDATFWACELEGNQQIVPIGRPIANMQAYILDPHLHPAPVGVPGELYLGGVDLARGYLNRPDLTAEKFIPDPFNLEAAPLQVRTGSSQVGDRLYKTGDLARYLPDGNIEFLGRIDHQVKVRGFRIELGEIETILREHPAVRETVVVAWEDGSGDIILRRDERLVAYLVPQKQMALFISELRSYLEEKLPDYMIPSTFVSLDALPLTPNGKVDRQALPAPDWTRPDLEGAFVAPRTPPEKVLAEIWAEALGLVRVGVYDDFFELGGNSLLATQIISRVRDVFQAQISLRSFFEASTIAELALLIGEIFIDEIEKLAEDEVQHLLQNVSQQVDTSVPSSDEVA